MVESGAMLSELAERDATGDLARIYAEIRAVCAVPYVSSMQRHLATRPGWLEWSWDAIRPAFLDGSAQTAAWQAVGRLDVLPLCALSRAELRCLGVDHDAERAIRATCESFVRVSPTNLVFSGLLRRLIEGERTGSRRPGAARSAERPAVGAGAVGAWTPPPALGALPTLVDPAGLDPDQRAVVASLGTVVDGQPFVPGLYRMLAHWPAYLAHVASGLRPRFDDPATALCCRGVLARIDATIGPLFERLPPRAATPPAPPTSEHGSVLAALERYRETSPQMIVFGSLLRDALPA